MKELLLHYKQVYWRVFSLNDFTFYVFTVAFPVALFPDFDALLEITFQSLTEAVALIVALIHVE